MAEIVEVSSQRTITGLLKKAAAEFPDQRALVFSGKWEFTHCRLDELVEEAAGRLLRFGVRPGDVIALTLSNSVELVVAFLAVVRVRAAAAPLNPTYTQDEFEFYLADSESRLLLTSADAARPSAAASALAAAKLGIPRLDIRVDHSNFALSIASDLSEDHPSATLSSVVNDHDDVALFLHTSGTTSRPKGVPLTQQHLAASAQNIAGTYELSPTDATVLVLPLFHVHGLVAGLLAPLSAGGSIVLPAAGRFSASTFWSDMRNHGATWYTAVPTIHHILLDRHEAKPEPSYPKLRFIRSCSAALSPAVMERLEEAFGAPVLEAYAMTEAAHQMASNPLPHRGPHKPGSVGRPVGLEMAILDEGGVVQKANANGEVCIRGPNVTKGYKNNPEANKTSFRYGWFHTGDLGYIDSDGYLHLVGRIKELINRGGEKISPIEVDSVLLSHPDVAQAVAFGVPDDKYGEEINCAVVAKEGATIDEEEFLRFCKRNLASFKVPKRVFVADALPKTATGKIQRRLVAEHFLAKVSAAKVPKFGA